MSLTDGKAESRATATGKGQASDISENDPERIRVAKNITNEVTIHRCATDGDIGDVPQASELPRPPEAPQRPDGPQRAADAAEPPEAQGSASSAAIDEQGSRASVARAVRLPGARCARPEAADRAADVLCDGCTEKGDRGGL